MRCPQCNKRIGFNERSNICPRCGAWLLRHPPSEHAVEHMRRGDAPDDFLNDFPWIGGVPGRRAVAFTAIWATTLVALAIGILVAFITFHFVWAVVLIFVTAAVGTAPSLFLIASRI